MKRFGLLLAATVLSTAVMFVSPAAAHVDVCTGTGTANLSAGFSLPPVTATADFSFELTGVCVTLGGGVHAHGKVTGACGLSTGEGTAVAHGANHDFTFTSVGTTLTLTGEVTGEVSAVEDPLDSGSCLNGTAQNFQITGTAVFNET